MPFDRLVRAVDSWAEATGQRDIFAQIGDAEYTPRSIEHKGFIEPPEFRDLVSRADLIVAHAGMGSILTALSAAKPIVIMPRRGAFRETRNDHQVATAEKLRGRPGIVVAMDEHEVAVKLDEARSVGRLEPIAPYASDRLIERIRGVVVGGGGEGDSS